MRCSVADLVMVTACLAGIGTQAIFAQVAAPETTNPKPAAARDSFVVSGQMDQVTGLNLGGGGSIDWVRQETNGAAVTAGFGSFSLGNSRWALGRAGAALKPTSRVTLSGLASLGAGDAAGTSFGYRTLNGEVIYKLNPKYYLKFGDKYFSVGNAHGNVLYVGALWRVSDLVAFDLTQYTSVSGNLNTDFFTARADFNFRAVRVFGGGSVGRVTPEIFNLEVGDVTNNRPMRQALVGAAFPMSRSEFIVSLDVLRLDNITRSTVAVALKFPIGK